LPHARENLALALTQAGRPQDAIVHFAEIVRENPSDLAAHRRLGVALAMSGRPHEAIASLQRAVELAPDDAVARNALGAALGSAGREEEALAQYDRAVRLDPRVFEARSNLGRTLVRTGRAEDGNRVLYELSVELLRAGQLEPALQEIEVILRNDPNHPARELLTRLAARQRAGGTVRQ
jgi:Flp pilus assembly protein TadD